MNQTSRVLLALLVLLSVGCRKLAVDVGDVPDGGVGGTGGTDSGSALGGAGGQTAASSSSGWTYFSILEGPNRAVDILFVVDNSPTMDPKQKALADSFPKMIEALQKTEGGLPDVHIGVISSDMGAGNGEAGGNCSIPLGNQGILWGNDPNVDPNDRNNKFGTVKDIQNGCGMNSGTRWIQDIVNGDGITRDKNYQGNLTDVFSCLAKSVGVGGCGYEHTLQSLRIALNPIVKTSDPNSVDVNPQNVGFLRRKAHLAIVIISDEDDCSADTNVISNDGMFAPRNLGDAASLRCATRGHVCNGQPIPNYDPLSGYTSSSPFAANFADCEAKDDTDTHNLPLIRVQDLIDSVKKVKDRPEEQIMVAGIIGWPENGDLSSVQYRIDKDPTAMPVEMQNKWDYMPICSVPDQKAADGNIYKAYGGLRLKKFIDGFGSNGQVYSICSAANFENAMKQIGNALVYRLRPACVMRPLVDTNPILPETQPECTATQKLSCATPGQGDCPADGYIPTAISQCIDQTTGNPLSPSNPATSNVPDDARPCWYLAYDTTPVTGCTEAYLGQRISMLRKGDGVAPTGSILALACRTCDSPSDLRCASSH